MDGQHISTYWLQIHINFFGFALLLDVNLQSCDSLEVRNTRIVGFRTHFPFDMGGH